MTIASGTAGERHGERGATLDRLERYFFVFVLLYAAGAIVQLAVLGPAPLRGTGTQEPVVLRALWAVCYVVFAGFALRQLALYAYVLRLSPVLLTLMAFMILSAAWSSEPLISLQHSVTVVIGIGIGIFLGMRYGADGVIRLLAITLGIALVASLVVMIALPRWGTMVLIHPGAWLGVFAHKNSLGSMSLLGILTFAYIDQGALGREKLLWRGLIVVALILIAGSESATAFAGLLILTVLGAGLRVFRRSSADVVLAVAGFLAALVGTLPIFVVILEQILQALGRDLTFTGRTDLWSRGLESFLHRPLLGYGFDSFWDDHSAYGGAQIRAFVGWATPHVHNSWLEVGLGLGLVGVVLFAVIFVGVFVRAIRLARATGDRAYYFVALFMLYLSLYSFNEQVFLLRNDILNLLLIAFATATSVDAAAFANRALPRAGRVG